MDIYWLDSPDCQDPFRVGGKAAHLGKLAARYPVPPGFCIAATNADSALSLADYIELTMAYLQLGERCGIAQPAVAVRSSAIDEDGHQASFAGQHETYLNIVGADAVAEAVQRCWASAHTERALHYRRQHGLALDVGVAVLVQQLVRSDVSAVVFSADPRMGDCDRIVINATWGLGESLVAGTVTPDLYVVRKADLEIVARCVAEKTRMTVARPGGTSEVPVPRIMQSEPALNDSQVAALARLARDLELDQGWPVDLECAYEQGRLYLLQCRPITTLPTLAKVVQPTPG